MSCLTKKEIHEIKQKTINKQFDEAKLLYQDLAKVEALDEHSAIRKLCVAIRTYVRGRPDEGCIAAYRLYKVAPWRDKDLTLVELIKKRFRTIKDAAKGTATQLKLAL